MALALLREHHSWRHHRPMLGRVDDSNPSLLRNFDIFGLGLLAIALASLEYVLEEGYRWGWMDDPDILRLTWISAVAAGLFIWRSLRHPSRVVDFRALKNRTFAIATLFIFVTGFGLFGAVYVLPLFLARIAGFNALQIGQAVFSAGLAMVLSAPLIARLSRKIDPRLLISVGLSLFARSLWQMTPITSEWTGRELFWPQFLRGFSILLCIVATDRAVAVLAHLTRRESATMAFSDALWMMSVLFFAALLLVPLIRRPAKPGQDATEAH
jgi:DHA2 family multidrug resistance protein